VGVLESDLNLHCGLHEALSKTLAVRGVSDVGLAPVSGNSSKEGDLEIRWDAEMCWCFIRVTAASLYPASRRYIFICERAKTLSARGDYMYKYICI